MSSGPIVACCFAKTDAIQGWRDLMGPTNTLAALEEAPTSLRARFGKPETTKPYTLHLTPYTFILNPKP
jgi:nucleoside-diphosphate kinase